MGGGSRKWLPGPASARRSHGLKRWTSVWGWPVGSWWDAWIRSEFGEKQTQNGRHRHDFASEICVSFHSVAGGGREGTGSPPNPAAIQETSPTPLPALLCNTTPPGCTSVLPPSLKPGPVGLVHPTQEQLPKLMTSLLLNAAVHSQPSLSSSRGCHSGLLHFPVPLTCPP